jgi:hypothetical protein
MSIMVQIARCCRTLPRHRTPPQIRIRNPRAMQIISSNFSKLSRIWCWARMGTDIPGSEFQPAAKN